MSRSRSFLRRARRSEVAALSGDALYVSVWQGSASAAELVQIALITHLLGLAPYGQYALVLAAVTLVGGIFKVRVSYAAITFGAEALERDVREAAGIFQLTFLVDVLTGLAGFLVVVALAPFVGADVTEGAGTGLIALAALSLFAVGPDDTCSSVLRLLDRFRLVAIYSAALELVRIALVVIALLVFESIAAVFVAIVVAKLARAVIGVVVGVKVFNGASGGARLTTPSLRHIRSEDRRPMFNMMFHTNFVSYGRVAQTQLPTLLLGGLAGVTETAIYKIGTAAASAVQKVIDPASAALLPRLARYWAAGDMRRVRRLIRNTSLISIPLMLVMVAILVPLRGPILELFGGGEEARAAGPALILGVIGAATYGAVFWHTTVLFTARRVGVVSGTTVVVAALQIGLVVLLVPSGGATGAAVALLAARVVSNAALTALAVRTLRQRESRALVASGGP